ncbi:protein-glutamate O-methyltransferase CheR [Pseudoalteromonas piscicida]|uniref:CheR family methyltransferase n=1 Tax=Pseudoalteromonas piscicida TaxID=43662 RepID=UPI0030AD0BC8
MQYIENSSFEQLQQWFYESTGILFNDSKRPLVSGRLQKRIRQMQLNNLAEYFELLRRDEAERQVAINLLTTNETYFFRESKHYDFLTSDVLPALTKQEKVSVWSAASSSGQEAYSIAMLMAKQWGLFKLWQIHGTDINTQVLKLAQRGVYPIDASEKIPADLLKRYCVKGKGKDTGFFMVMPDLKKHVTFKQTNLLKVNPIQSSYDVIFLRNVLIYFNMDEKLQILSNVLNHLRPGGWLFVGHSESVTGFDTRLQQVKPGCYRFIV